jgi:hypothetical protein
MCAVPKMAALLLLLLLLLLFVITLCRIFINIPGIPETNHDGMVHSVAAIL